MLKKCFRTFALLGIVASVPIMAIEISVETPNGERMILDVSPDQTIGDIITHVNEHCAEEGHHGIYLLGLYDVNDEDDLVCKANHLRDYYAAVSESVVKDIRFIVLTLGNKPLVKLKKYKSSLKSAGDNLENTHPLNVWRIIFSNNDTVSAMHSIKRRKEVWKSFIKGMAKSLQEASDRNNITPEHIQDFSDKLGINAASITPYLTQQDWTGFVKALLIIVPREGEPDRYDQ